MLPSLQGKTIIDIGSRIGAVLYGAYYYSAASRIVGVEINSDLCRIEQGIVEKYKLGDRVSVVEGDMCTLGDLIRTGDVVVLNNVFDWFMATEVQVTMWTFLRATLAPGSLLVIIPSLISNALVMVQAGHFRETARRFWPMFVATVPGVLLGLAVLDLIDSLVAGAILGVVLIGYGTFTLFRPSRPLCINLNPYTGSVSQAHYQSPRFRSPYHA